MTDQTLLSAAGLEAALSDPRLLVVDCRFDLADPDGGARGYAAGHLPGAVYASLEGVLSGEITATSGRHPLPSPEAFARTLCAWGLTPETRVAAYDQGPGAGAARLWWMLRAIGHDTVQVLDGGLARWVAEGRALTQAVPVRPGTTVAPRRYQGDLSSDAVKAALRRAETRLVYARSADRFAGRNETIDPVAGHVPGAVNHPFLGNLGPDGQFLPAEALRERWQATLAGHAPDQLIAMCGSGVTACHNLLALQVAGLPGGRLYAGSWSEWIRDPARPVATGEAT
jgi:thiosulfate/3-mercaptopyruvate sulfurtransferase